MAAAGEASAGTEGEQAPEEAPAPYWKCVAAALPELYVAAQFVMVGLLGKPFPGADREWLTAIMQAEFLVVHSMAFLGFIALWKPVDAKAAKTRAIAFWAMFAFYVALALSTGWKQLTIFVSLTFVTYLGLFLNWRSPSAMVQLGVRWAVGMALFLLAVGLCGAPKDVDHWKLDPAVLRAGAIYFFALAAVELSGLYLRTIPRNWQRILELLRKGRPRHS